MAKDDEKIKIICADCKGIAYVGGAQIYQCVFTGEALDRKTTEERIEVKCDKFDPAPRMMRIKMKDLVEVGITTVYGGGSVQLPKRVREELEIKDGDKILWIRKGLREFTFRKVGYTPPFVPHFV